ncbi:MAG: hypothetical protein LIP11_10805 [Clostridiales bacterium]|nr:hypothetical protein [Clostridiales bacterium]
MYEEFHIKLKDDEWPLDYIDHDRHNVNHYYLCKVISFGETNLTEDEKNEFHLSVLKLDYQEAVREYERCADTKLGRLVAKRELPVLQYAKKVIDGGACSGSESL